MPACGLLLMKGGFPCTVLSDGEIRVTGVVPVQQARKLEGDEDVPDGLVDVGFGQ